MQYQVSILGVLFWSNSFEELWPLQAVEGRGGRERDEGREGGWMNEWMNDIKR